MLPSVVCSAHSTHIGPNIRRLPVFQHIKTFWRYKTLPVQLRKFPWNSVCPRRKSSSLKPFLLSKWNIKCNVDSTFVQLVYQSHTHSCVSFLKQSEEICISVSIFQTVFLSSLWCCVTPVFLDSVGRWFGPRSISVVKMLGNSFNSFSLVRNIFPLSQKHTNYQKLRQSALHSS